LILLSITIEHHRQGGEPMRLATLGNGTRDGQLVVVSPDLSRMRSAEGIAATLQDAIEDWGVVAPQLQGLAATLSAANSHPFDPSQALAPLPRSYQWADGSAYLNHVELVRKARGAEVPASFFTDPLMYQGGSDSFLAPTAPIAVADEAWGVDMEAEIAVIVDDVPMGITPAGARDHIKLVMLVNDVSLRNLIPAELGKGFGFFQSKPSTAFSPLAVTPAALGDAWDGVRMNRPLAVDLNGRPFGRANAGLDMTFDFAELIAHAARTRRLIAGTIIGSGTVSNKMDGGPGQPIDRGGAGYSCIAEIRMIETLQHGEPSTPFMHFGDTVRIWMDDDSGQSIFGAIEQTVVQFEG